MNIEGRGVYKMTTISVRGLPFSVFQILSEHKLLLANCLIFNNITKYFTIIVLKRKAQKN